MILRKLYGALDFAASQAAGASVNMGRRTVDDRLDTLYVGLPHTVRAPVGVADLDAESHTFSADFTFCHRNQLLPAVVLNYSLSIIADHSENCKLFFQNRKIHRI